VNVRSKLRFLRPLRKQARAVIVRAAGTITHVETTDLVAALTFDDGPDPVWTPRVLDVLEAHHARATFFMVGELAAKHRDLVRKVAEAGHAIGNHSWDHPSFPQIGGVERRAQIRACERAIAPYGRRLFRPPYGHQTVASRLDALWLRYEVVLWNLSAVDWLDRSPATIAGQLVDGLRPGSVILFHDGLVDATEERFFDREPMLEAVRMLLDRVGGTFKFVTVPELLRHGTPRRRTWVRQDPEILKRVRRQTGEGRRYPEPASRVPE
jgi:peptidoglycan/xylan/chitin deacetylase (PgdA/CDA1 family)